MSRARARSKIRRSRREGPASLAVTARSRMARASSPRTAVLTPGDLVIYDTTRPYTLDHPERTRLHLLHLLPARSGRPGPARERPPPRPSAPTTAWPRCCLPS
ncbi:hypothetical protein [Nonomuraea africana]|uniref:hypothetical protein n=1 Tax=Nonomuraea africana TaxID=46171 RepID=UPI0033FC1510